ncbi:MAG TPA: hypothetical protein DDW18_03445 [Firmicutes bacterium]|nr:hypothetical protein [Bacillota bacterium]
MKTRMEKYKKYRERILRTPDEKFENKKTRQVEVSKEEIQAETPYTEYRRKEIRMYSLKGCVLFLAVILFILLYLFWVRK